MRARKDVLAVAGVAVAQDLELALLRRRRFAERARRRQRVLEDAEAEEREVAAQQPGLAAPRLLVEANAVGALLDERLEPDHSGAEGLAKATVVVVVAVRVRVAAVVVVVGGGGALGLGDHAARRPLDLSDQDQLDRVLDGEADAADARRRPRHHGIPPLVRLQDVEGGARQEAPAEVVVDLLLGELVRRPCEVLLQLSQLVVVGNR